MSEHQPQSRINLLRDPVMAMYIFIQTAPALVVTTEVLHEGIDRNKVPAIVLGNISTLLLLPPTLMSANGIKNFMQNRLPLKS